jgi:hypothetical protein
MRQEDHSHPAAPDLAFDRVAVAEGLPQASQECHVIKTVRQYAPRGLSIPKLRLEQSRR